MKSAIKKYSDLKLPLDDLSGKIISQLLALRTFQLYIIAFFCYREIVLTVWSDLQYQQHLETY